MEVNENEHENNNSNEMEKQSFLDPEHFVENAIEIIWTVANTHVSVCLPISADKRLNQGGGGMADTCYISHLLHFGHELYTSNSYRCKSSVLR